MSWRGLGRTLDATADYGGTEGGISDDEICTMLHNARTLLAGRELQGLEAMLGATGTALSVPVRRAAVRAKSRLAVFGVVLPPWWRLRLAIKRTTGAKIRYGRGGRLGER